MALIGTPAPPLPPGYTWNSDKYERVVYTWLARIQAKQTGQAVMRWLWSRPLTIRPYLGTDKNATTAGDGAGAIAEGAPFNQCTANPAQQNNVGTGTGSSIIIRFTPRLFDNPTGAGDRADEVLLHEMVHAVRYMHGKARCRNSAGHMDSEEEVIAITITNMYSSEVGRPLRAHHGDYSVLQSSPAEYIQQFEKELLSFWAGQESMCKELAELTQPWFNPFSILSPGV
jgi:hypothetical protein